METPGTGINRGNSVGMIPWRVAGMEVRDETLWGGRVERPLVQIVQNLLHQKFETPREKSESTQILSMDHPKPTYIYLGFCCNFVLQLLRIYT